MSNSKSTFRLIAPKPLKPQDFFMQNSDIIAVATFTPSPENEEVVTNEIQITEPPSNTSAMPITTAKIKKKQVKVVKVGYVEDEGGWDDKSTGLLKGNFSSNKKNKSNFTKTAASKLFLGRPWEQVKNKLSCLVNRYNNIKEKEGQTGREAQAKWKWFERLNSLFGTCDNHNLGCL